MVFPACPWPLRTCQPFSGFRPACFYGGSVFLSCPAKGELARVTHFPSMDSSLFRIEYTQLPYNLSFLIYSHFSVDYLAFSHGSGGSGIFLKSLHPKWRQHSLLLLQHPIPGGLEFESISGR